MPRHSTKYNLNLMLPLGTNHGWKHEWQGSLLLARHRSKSVRAEGLRIQVRSSQAAAVQSADIFHTGCRLSVPPPPTPDPTTKIHLPTLPLLDYLAPSPLAVHIPLQTSCSLHLQPAAPHATSLLLLLNTTKILTA